VDAIHPGYGFLAENAEFAEKCEATASSSSVPPQRCSVPWGTRLPAVRQPWPPVSPVVPGTEDPIEREEEALKFAKESGYPIIIKAAAGGGGRGMRVARNKKELLEGLVAAASEAKAAFGNATVFLERYIENPKHIEVQVLGDNYGNLVHLFERDCSIQRRHQKVVEFAPSLCLTQQQREEICTAALKIAGQVKYRNAGTVEFLVDQEGSSTSLR
jgi:pyruvate carboxylase